MLHFWQYGHSIHLYSTVQMADAQQPGRPLNAGRRRSLDLSQRCGRLGCCVAPHTPSSSTGAPGSAHFHPLGCKALHARGGSPWQEAGTPYWHRTSGQVRSTYSMYSVPGLQLRTPAMPRGPSMASAGGASIRFQHDARHLQRPKVGTLSSRPRLALAAAPHRTAPHRTAHTHHKLTRERAHLWLPVSRSVARSLAHFWRRTAPFSSCQDRLGRSHLLLRLPY